MASKPAQKRLSKEFVTMQREPPPFVWAAPDEKNILVWNYLICGPPDSPYAGGEYHGVLLFPAEYPFKPPGIKMYTPSGRFQPDKKICFSMSDFHPGSWNPAWSVATILTGLLSFMLADEMTTGSVTSSDVHKRAFAARSHVWNLGQARFRDAFPEYCTTEPKDLPNMGQKERGKAEGAGKAMGGTDGVISASPSIPGTRSRSSTGTAPSSSTSGVVNAAGARAGPIPNAAANSPTAAAGTTNNAVGKQGQGVNPTGWATAWRQVVYEKWRWCALIALAVIVSRFSTA